MFLSCSGSSTLRSTWFPAGPRSVTRCALVSTLTTSARTVTCRAPPAPGLAPGAACVAPPFSVMVRGLPPPFFSSSESASLYAALTFWPTLSWSKFFTSGPATTSTTLPLAVLSVTMRYVESIETITADAVVVLVATALPGVTATLELVAGACCAPAAKATLAASIAAVMGANFMGNLRGDARGRPPQCGQPARGSERTGEVRLQARVAEARRAVEVVAVDVDVRPPAVVAEADTEVAMEHPRHAGAAIDPVPVVAVDADLEELANSLEVPLRRERPAGAHADDRKRRRELALLGDERRRRAAARRRVAGEPDPQVGVVDAERAVELEGRLVHECVLVRQLVHLHLDVRLDVGADVIDRVAPLHVAVEDAIARDVVVEIEEADVVLRVDSPQQIEPDARLVGAGAEGVVKVDVGIGRRRSVQPRLEVAANDEHPEIRDEGVLDQTLRVGLLGRRRRRREHGQDHRKRAREQPPRIPIHATSSLSTCPPGPARS